MEKGRIALNQNGNNSSGFRLDGKVAIITGGASGIGRALAFKFALHGAKVYILDLDEAESNKAIEEIVSVGGTASWQRCDVADHAQVQETFRTIGGSGPIDILVNNAGIAHIGSLEKTTEADFDRVFRVNVKGVYNCTYAVLDHLKARGGGVILNLASIAACAGLADRFAYSMSKGAVLTMTYSIARDCIPFNIRCNCISPARVHTPFVDGFVKKNYPGHEDDMMKKLAHLQPIGRMAQPEEVASLALFLCSNEASFITGTNYPIDGGFLNLHG